LGRRPRTPGGWRALRRPFAARGSRRRSRSTLLGRHPDRLDDLVVTGAPAEIPEHPLPDLRLARVRIRVEERLGRHDLARGADAALKSAGVDERLLDGMESLVLGEALDGRDRAAVREDRQRDAGADHLAVEKNGARAADADAAPFLGAREPEIVPEAVEERAVGGNLHVVRFSI